MTKIPNEGRYVSTSKKIQQPIVVQRYAATSLPLSSLVTLPDPKQPKLSSTESKID